MIGVVYLREENYSNERKTTLVEYYKNVKLYCKKWKKKESISYLYLIRSASAF